MKLKNILPRINLILSTQLGIDLPRLFRGVFALPGYAKDLKSFKSKYKGRLILNPCLLDKNEESGSAKSEYFLQDLYVAQKIFQANPGRHLDVGSRVDGFVAHVASFREIEVVDIRPATAVIPGIKFIQADLMAQNLMDFDAHTDSLSCLHALEHFGLGRYGDPINPMGHESGLKNISKLLKKSGSLYLSLPIGVERVEFNSHRVVNPFWLIDLATAHNLYLIDLAYIDSDCRLIVSKDAMKDCSNLATIPYSLAIFTFQKQ